MSVLRCSASVIVAAALLAPPLAAQTIVTNTPPITPPTGATGLVFGLPTPATVGQTITVPTTDNVLESFSFWLGGSTNGADLRFNAHVVQWDPVGQVTVGPMLFTSGPFSGNGSTGYVRYDFATGGVALTSNTMYALLLSASGVPQGSTETVLRNLVARGFGGGTFTDTYAGGGFVLKPLSGDPLNPLPPWDTDVSDLVFEARFTSPVTLPPPTVVPEPATVLLVGSGLAAVALVGRRRRAT